MSFDIALGSVHATLRSVLNNAARCLQQTDFLDEYTTEVALDALASALHLCREHDANKTTLVFPLLDSFEPSVVAALQQDVVTNNHVLAQLETRIAEWQAATSAFKKTEAGHYIKRLFSRFLIITRTNLAREEMMHGFLKKYYNSASLYLMENKLQFGLSPAEQNEYNLVGHK